MGNDASQSHVLAFNNRIKIRLLAIYPGSGSLAINIIVNVAIRAQQPIANHPIVYEPVMSADSPKIGGIIIIPIRIIALVDPIAVPLLSEPEISAT